MEHNVKGIKTTRAEVFLRSLKSVSFQWKVSCLPTVVLACITCPLWHLVIDAIMHESDNLQPFAMTSFVWLAVFGGNTPKKDPALQPRAFCLFLSESIWE